MTMPNRMFGRGPGESRWLVLGGLLSLAAALLHIGCIVGGTEWYRFFGAPDPLIRADRRGDMTLAYTTTVIAAILAIWAAYAFAGAGRLRRLPLMRTALVIISAIYLLRGLSLFPVLALHPERVDSFAVWSSLIVLVYGIAYAVGTWQAWPYLSRKEPV
ncbi:hypothetical protein [Novosphingopyxis sp.]|uniref:hypothetical protein n=1 Tax=Novosphingopyxis sp. TaxID=2709690 RepID=UPI003B5B3D0C